MPNGQKRKKADWEAPWYVGMYGAMGLAGLLLYYKPDTRCVLHAFSIHLHLLIPVTSVSTWALEEAKTRMEARGEKTEYP